MVYGRDDRGRLDRGNATLLGDAGDKVALPDLDILLSLSDIYEDIVFATG